MSWTSFSFTGAPVTVEVHTPRDFNNCLVRPTSYGYACSRYGTKVTDKILASVHSAVISTVECDLGTLKLEIKRKKELKIAHYYPIREIHTVAARAAPEDLGLKSHLKDFQQKLTNYYGHPSKYKPRPMLLNPIVPGSWP